MMAMMSTRMLHKRRRGKMDEEGGTVGKQRTVRKQIRDTTRLLSRVSANCLILLCKMRDRLFAFIYVG